jgi:hypothetical protein
MSCAHAGGPVLRATGPGPAQSYAGSGPAR